MGYAEIQDLKVQSRLLLKKQILDLSFQEHQNRSEQLTQNLRNHLSNETGKWGAFTPLRSEPDVNWQQASSKIDWYFVQVHQDRLQFSHNNKKTISAQDLDGICVPGLGFHTNGARLGRGGGYYDRELSQFKKPKVGIAFDFAVNEQLPYESHDIIVDAIITDRRVIKRS